MSSTVTNRCWANWMIIDDAFNHERLIEFLEALVRDRRRALRKVFLILDNFGVHHCKPVNAWLAEHMADIEASYLPSYSPELNPDERLADLKDAIGTKDKLYVAASAHMAFIEATPERVRAYTPGPLVEYAARCRSAQRAARWPSRSSLTHIATMTSAKAAAPIHAAACAKSGPTSAPYTERGTLHAPPPPAA